METAELTRTTRNEVETFQPNKNDLHKDTSLLPEVIVDNVKKNLKRRNTMDLKSPYEDFRTRNLEIGIITSTNSDTFLEGVRKLVEISGKKGIAASQDPEVVAVVAQGTAMQKALLDPSEEELEKPGFLTNYIDRRKAAEQVLVKELEAKQKQNESPQNIPGTASQERALEGTSRTPEEIKVSVENTDTIIARFQERNKLTQKRVLRPGAFVPTLTDVVTEEELKAARDAARKKEAKDTGVDILLEDLGEVSKPVSRFRVLTSSSTVENNTEGKGNGVDILLGDRTEDGRREPGFASTEQVLTSGVDRTEQIERFNKSVEEWGHNTENVTEGLVERNNGNVSKLKGFGLKMKSVGLGGLVGGLEFFGKMSPKKRLLYGVGLAGLSVATGGLLSALPLFLSAGSFASNIYKKHAAKYEKPVNFESLSLDQQKEYLQKNAKFLYLSDEEKKARIRKHAVRAALFGVALTAATSFGASLLFPYVSDAAHAVGEKISSAVHDVSDFFGNVFSHTTATPDISGSSGLPSTAPSTPTTTPSIDPFANGAPEPAPPSLADGSIQPPTVPPTGIENTAPSPSPNIPVVDASPTVLPPPDIDGIIQARRKELFAVMAEAAGKK